MFLDFIISVKAIELLALILSLLYVIFNARQNIFTWFCGFFSSILYFYIFFISNLYVSSILSITYGILSVYGFVNWKRKKDGSIIKVTYLSNKSRLTAVLSASLLSVIIYILFRDRLYYDLLLGDSIIAGFSVISSILSAKKHPETWIGWVFTNSIAVFVYFKNGLVSTSLLYLLFIVLSIYGYISWTKLIGKEGN